MSQLVLVPVVLVLNINSSKEPKRWPKMESEDRSRYILDPSLYSPEQKAKAEKWKRMHGDTLEFMRPRVMPTATPTKQPVTQGNGDISCGKVGDETDEWETVSEDSDTEESKFTPRVISMGRRRIFHTPRKRVPQ